MQPSSCGQYRPFFSFLYHSQTRKICPLYSIFSCFEKNCPIFPYRIINVALYFHVVFFVCFPIWKFRATFIILYRVYRICDRYRNEKMSYIVANICHFLSSYICHRIERFDPIYVIVIFWCSCDIGTGSYICMYNRYRNWFGVPISLQGLARLRLES